MELLERSDQLSALADSLAAVIAEASGALVLVGGEAGVGKTVLLQAFCEHNRDSARILWGACEALLTPGPLGPLFDIAEVTRGDLQELVSRGARPHEITAALIGELAGAGATILVLEDLHWADEATLDVLRLLARKAQSVPALIVASYAAELSGDRERAADARPTGQGWSPSRATPPPSPGQPSTPATA